jgi:hypothetical protein
MQQQDFARVMLGSNRSASLAQRVMLGMPLIALGSTQVRS